MCGLPGGERERENLPSARMRHRSEASALKRPSKVERELRAAEFTCQPVGIGIRGWAYSQWVVVAKMNERSGVLSTNSMDLSR